MSALEIKFDCPECAEGLVIDRRAIGHQVACPFCKDPITVPDIPEQGQVAPVSMPGLDRAAAPSLEELASSRPDVTAPASHPSPSSSSNSSTATQEPETKSAPAGGLPPKRRPGEQPKAMAEDSKAAPARTPPPRQPAPPTPPRGAAPRPPAAQQNGSEKTKADQGGGEKRPSQPGAAGAGERRSRRKRKKNPDDHRLNPREHPKMVAFDEVVGEDTFRRRAAAAGTPLWKKIGVIALCLGILGAIGLGVLKQIELRTPDETTKAGYTESDKLFLEVKERLDGFREGNTIDEKLSYLRVPVTEIDTYPPLRERIENYYGRNGLSPHFPILDMSTTTRFTRGESEYVRVAMRNKGVESFVYFEKSIGGYLVDWDSFVGYNPRSWITFLVNPDGQSETSIFRLFMTPGKDGDYKGRYQDKDKYRAFRVTDVQSDLKAVAYVVRGTPAAEGIARQFDTLTMDDEKQIQVIVEATLAERAADQTALVYVDRLLREDWLLP